MSNINKIKVSGQTYNIQDQNATKTVELTQAEYDALAVKDPNTFYVITDAQGADLTAIENRLSEDEEVTAAGLNALNDRLSEDEEVTAAGLNALNESKQDTLVSGTNIKTINNESILGSGNINIQGGGKAIEAGRGIFVTTGETADTVSFNLPISAGTGTNSIVEGTNTKAIGSNSHAEGNSTTARGLTSHAEGSSTTASGQYSHAEGTNTTASGNQSHAEGNGTKASGLISHAEGNGTKASGTHSHTEGYQTIANNESEHASGQYNVSSSASTEFGDSGNTLFSVGNGTLSARHNAFEIRQNGDIYLTKDGQDVKLQDQLGGGGGKAVSGGTNISITTGETADTINCTLPISKGSGNNNSLILGTGNGNTASGQYSIAVGGRNNSSSKYCSLVSGNENNVSNEFETAFGNSNKTNYASTTFGDSGNTIFSVGNGSNYNLRHNAFEIRQDGSIYIPDLSNGTSYRDRPMIKLQDTITALGGLKLVKLTQSAYDALSPNYDSNTLYVIVN